jgi:hypothetical protein
MVNEDMNSVREEARHRRLDKERRAGKKLENSKRTKIY